MSNRNLIRKAELLVNDLQTGGGYLQPEQAKTFYEIAIKESELLSMVQRRALKSHSYECPKMAYLDTILQCGTECTPAETTKPEFQTVTLNTKLFRACTVISDEALEDNIERGTFQSHVVRLMAKRFTADMEDVILNGDTALVEATPGSPTPREALLQSFDGIRKQITANVASNSNLPLTDDSLRNLFKLLPTEYCRDRKKLVYLTSCDARMDYRHDLAGRATQAGDMHLASISRSIPDLYYNGIPVMDIPLMPEDLGTGTQTEAILIDPKNIMVGLVRDVRVEFDRDVKAGCNIIAATARFGVKVIHDPAAAKLTEVSVS